MVVPVVLRGNREALPEGTWWPRRAQLEVEIREPLPPGEQAAADPFARAAGLRDATQRAIAAHLVAE